MSNFADSDNIDNEIEILTNKKEELTNLLNSSKSNILSQALTQELKNIKGKLEVLKNKKPTRFIDVYDNFDEGDNYLSKNKNYDLSEVTSFEPNKLREIKKNKKKELKQIEPIDIYNKEQRSVTEIQGNSNLLKIYNKYVKKDKSSDNYKQSNSESSDFRTQSLLNCKEIIGIVKMLEKNNKNNKLILKLKNTTRKLAKNIDKQFKMDN